MNKLVLKFDVRAKEQAEVMAIGKAISEHLASVHDVVLTGVEYGWDVPKPVKSEARVIQPELKKSNNHTGKSKPNNTKPNNHRAEKSEGFIPEAELQASKRYKNGSHN
jgi:hypothetical protein